MRSVSPNLLSLQKFYRTAIVKIRIKHFYESTYFQGKALHPMMDPYHGRVLGWTPRQQEGWHIRRVGGTLFMQGAPMVPDRPDGRMKPGELQNGAYGFYYKGQQTQVQQPSRDVLADL